MPTNITIQRILVIVLQRIKFIILLTLVCMLSFFLYSKFFITPMYSTSAMLYVQNYNAKSQSNQENGKIFSSDISGSASLAEAYIVFLYYGYGFGFRPANLCECSKSDLRDCRRCFCRSLCIRTDWYCKICASSQCTV